MCRLFLLVVFGLFILVEIETLVESVNTSAGINKLLLTGEVRMAVGANINTHILFG